VVVTGMPGQADAGRMAAEETTAVMFGHAVASIRSSFIAWLDSTRALI
jgi:hypothetical protein